MGEGVRGKSRFALQISDVNSEVLWNRLFKDD